MFLVHDDVVYTDPVYIFRDQKVCKWYIDAIEAE